jgi:DNA-binding NarL/FixJ family response regulator
VFGVEYAKGRALGLAGVLAGLERDDTDAMRADEAPPAETAPAEATSLLTPRELDVLKLVAQGLSNPDIAQRLFLSEHTVHRHLANILRKLDLSSRAAAAAWGVRTGLV